jgi:hypothetical protein
MDKPGNSKEIIIRASGLVFGALMVAAVIYATGGDLLFKFDHSRADVRALKVFSYILVIVVSTLQIIFSLLKIRLNKYSIPFEIIYFLTVFVSVVRIAQFGHQYFAGEMSPEDWGILSAMEIGAYSLNLVSLVIYSINKTMFKLTKDMYEKCDICGGDLYCHGVPERRGDYKFCGLCKGSLKEKQD